MQGVVQGLTNGDLAAASVEEGQRGKSPSRDAPELEQGHREKRMRMDGTLLEDAPVLMGLGTELRQPGMDDEPSSHLPLLQAVTPLFPTPHLANPFSQPNSSASARIASHGSIDTSFQDSTSLHTTDLESFLLSDAKNELEVEQDRPKRSLGFDGGVLKALGDSISALSKSIPRDHTADDSGIFMSDDIDLAVDEDSIPTIGGDESLVMQEEMDFDGDEMWEGFEEDAAYEVGARGQAAVDVLPLPPQLPSQEQDDDAHYYDGPDPYAIANAADPAFDPNALPTFQFVRQGKAVVLSDAAMKKAQALFDDDDEAEAVSTTEPAFVGFATGRGGPLALSEAALARARRLVMSSPSQADELPLPTTRPTFTRPSFTRPTDPLLSASVSTPAPIAATTGFGGLTSGSGAVLAGPSQEGLRMAAAALDRDVFGVSPSGSGPVGAFRLAPTRSQHGEDNTVVESPTTNRTAINTAVNGTRPPLLPLVNAAPAPFPSSPVRRAKPRGKNVVSPPPQPLHHSSSPRDQTFQSPSSSSRAAQTAAPPAPPISSTPSRPAAIQPPTLAYTPVASTSRITTRPATTTPAFRVPLLRNSASKTTPLKATPALRRLNFGMTPRPRPLQPHRFSTPFKGGVRPVGLTSAGVVGTPSSVSKGKGKEVAVVKSNLQAVFDLTPLSNRLSLRDFVGRPQTHFYEHLEELGLPDEILGMDSVSAVSFTFECGRGDKSALECLLRDDCSLATLPWVKNHWSLVIWKLASLVRSKPELLSEYWRWEVAVNRLKYRYEREVNNAQRSCIKRIQEQDSPSTLPMVLCVSQIRWADPPDVDTLKEGEEALLVIAGLELTDGWYRIRAAIDGTLKSACERGKIVVGSKLTIIGARIESSRDGTEVLEALSRSTITIAGNSTSLAAWDTKLGFTQSRCIASLDVLTSAGGVASLLDVVIERVFPYGYVDLRKNSNHGTWNETEERLQADEWEKGRAKAQGRLAEELERTDGEWDGIVNLLRDVAQRLGPPSPPASSAGDPDAEEPDEILDRLESAVDKAAILRRLSSRQVHDCLKLACENAVQDKQSAVADLEKDLATSFPPRDVRGFRVLRIRDARSNEGKAVSSRTAQLTVWDAKTLGDGFFKEGQRYLVSNLAPKGTWKRISSEITLATRRDSRWQVRE